ncbi:MAG: hypothetical protein LBV39_04205, partial [Bacteroidales bacterium]|nr:hypothetical protein [Bacteroidales bacterium]
MARIKYKYNPESLSYDKVHISLRDSLRRIALFVAGSLVLGVMYFGFFSSVFITPKEQRLVQELDKLQLNYKVVSQRVDQMVKM